ncbi:DNA primase family protein [Gemmata obscuriglobus]|nr:phage/plasmid primase, P4 family [Gemmata obscuriglobus]
MTETVSSDATAWRQRADDLARWAMLRIVNRTDRCGGCYIGDDGEVKRTTRPSRGAQAGFVDHARLVRHFGAIDTPHVMGLHAIGPDGTGKWVGVDIDAHPGQPCDPAANERFALSVYAQLVELRFRPVLAESNGSGGYHLLALFADPVAGSSLFAFGRWLVRDYAQFGFGKMPETFPKQTEINESTKYGNWLRLVGRHHKRNFWPRVYDGSNWLDGARAVDHVLSLTGDPTDLIPPDALEVPQAPQLRPAPAPRAARVTRTAVAAGGASGPDVFAAFNAAATERSVADMLERNGWVDAGRRGARWDFRRPGKGGDKSGNIMVVSGVPLFYGFTDAAGIPFNQGLNPSWLRCHLEFGGDFARLAERLRDEGYAPRRVRPAAPVVGGPDSPAPPEGGAAAGEGDEEPVHEEFMDPHRLGRLLVPRQGDLPTAIYHRGEWWEWRAGKYVTVADNDFDLRGWNILRAECEAAHLVAVAAWEHGGRQGARPAVPKLDTRKISNAVTAAASMVHLEADTTWPAMLSADPPRPNRIPRVRPAAEQREYIACANGLLDVAELLASGAPTLVPATPLYFTPAAIPVAFDASAKCPRFDSFLERVTDGDRERQLILQEIAGYLLRFDTRFQQFFVLTGEGSNGKSTFLAVLRALIGDHNYASVPLEEFGERFALGVTLGKLVNAVAEVGELDKVAEAKLKSFVGADLMSFDRKNKAPISARPTARLLLSTNTLPRFADRSEGVWRRYQLVPFTTVITDGEKVHGMSDPGWWIASGELPGVLNWALAGLHRLYQQGGFSSSKVGETAKAEHREICNPHRQFLEDHLQLADADKTVRTTEVYAAYVEWCRARKFLSLNDANFGVELRKVFKGVTKVRKRVGRDREQVYAGVSWGEGGRPDILLGEYDRKRRDSSGWSPDQDVPP